tara:strand:+ start:719 stop:2395 length:1677 start_codon:yes stop_codon:yes gene_type:complete
MFASNNFFRKNKIHEFRCILSGFEKMSEIDFRKINYLRKKLFNLDYKIPKFNFLNFFVQNKYLIEVTSLKIKDIFFNDNGRFRIFSQEIIKSHAAQKYKQNLKLGCPNIALKFLKKNDYKVNFFYSTIMWYIFILANFSHGIFLGIKTLFVNIISREKINHNKFVFCEMNYSKEEILKFNYQSNFFFLNKIIDYFKIQNSKIIFKDFFSLTSFNEKNVDKVKSNIVLLKYTHLPYFDSLLQLFYFFIWFVFSSFFIIILLLIGKWSYSLIFYDIVEDKIHRITSYKYIPSLYVKPYMGSLHKPLWTYYAEEKKMKSYFIFYSTNESGYPTNKHIPIDESNRAQLKWKNYLVWDDYQGSVILKNVINNPAVHVLGPMLINVQSDEKKYFLRDKKYISIFDIAPKRKIKACMQGGYYTTIFANFMNQFLLDISDLSEKYKIHILHKPKRDLNKLSKGNIILKENKSYNAILNKINKREYFKSVPANFDLKHLVDNSLATICYPYTSVALISKELKKETIFYDSSLEIIDNKDFSRNLKLISGKQELDSWFSKILSNQKIS